MRFPAHGRGCLGVVAIIYLQVADVTVAVVVVVGLACCVVVAVLPLARLLL